MKKRYRFYYECKGVDHGRVIYTGKFDADWSGTGASLDDVTAFAESEARKTLSRGVWRGAPFYVAFYQIVELWGE